MGLSSHDRSELFHAILNFLDEYVQDKDVDLIDLEGTLGLLQKFLYARKAHQLEHEAAQRAATAADEPEEPFLPPPDWKPAAGDPPPTSDPA